MISLKHPVKDFLSSDDVTLLCSSVKFNTYCSHLEHVALQHYDGNDDDRNKFKGDLFELFVEFLIKYKGTDNRIAICDYKVIEETEYTDYGVDGIGKSTINSKASTVQVKYRQQKETLTWNTGNFGNFGFQSLQLIMKVGGHEQFPIDNTQMLYITAAGGVHYSTDEIASGQIRVIDRNGLRTFCDNVDEFWIAFKDAILRSQIKPVGLSGGYVLRDHQVCAVNAIIDDMRIGDGHGRIILPTGTGKTLIQAQTIIDANREFGHQCFVIFSPRILLAYQHLVNVSEHLIGCGVDAEFLNVNSGNFDERLINAERMRAGFSASKVHSTTSNDEITRIYEKIKKDNKILVISSTYHSANRIREAGIEVDLQLNDEAHNVVSEEFSNCHGIGKNCFHFTATEKYTDSDDGLGMNNEAVWGNLTFEKLPKEMIEAGEMLPPVLHIVEVSQSQIADNDYNAIFAAISESFCEHRKRLNSESANPSAIGPKLLVTLNGQETLKGLMGEKGKPGCINFEAYKVQNPNVAIFAISSELGAYIDGTWHDSSNKTKDILLQRVRKLNDSEEAIIIYVDMLTEGIDVPGITAFMPLRGMNESRFIQGVGRATRLFHIDRTRFYNHEISPQNRSDYVKPYAEIIIPTILINSRDTAAQYIRLWQSLYDSFGHHEHVVFSTYRGMADESELDDLNVVDRDQQSTDSGIDAFLHSIVGRPDRLDIHELWLIMAIRDKCDGGLISQFYCKMRFKGHLDTYKSIAKWQKQNNTSIASLINMMRNSGQSVFSDEIKKKFGTIYTPEFVVKKTVDTAWKYIPEKADKLKLTYCDPAAGDGNFLEYVYDKLMEETSIQDPIKRSYHILTKCLWGFEILDAMVKACKIRLVLLHKQTIQENNGDPKELLILMDELNIHYGNTIVLPDDIEQEWYKERAEWEGGLLSESLRNKKFDVIIGNPPYTHLRNMNNRRYAAYPKQRDMAQVFVRWALDHLNEDGVIGYNTSDAWLAKISDGALETRSLLNKRMTEYLQTDDIQTYSAGDGGDVSTCILTLQNNKENTKCIINSKIVNIADIILKPGFIQIASDIDRLYEFKNISITKYAPNLRGGRSINKQDMHSQFYKNWRDMIYFNHDNGEYHIMVKRRLYNPNGTASRFVGSFKLVQTDNVQQCVDEKFESEIKNIKINFLYGLWIIGYLNTEMSFRHVDTFTRKTARQTTGFIYEISSNLWPLLQVPDYDHYKTNHPKQFQDYMDWIENNMRDKDAFLAGIDEQFGKLIK